MIAMNRNKRSILFATVAAGLMLTSCDQVAEKAKEEIKVVADQTNDRVQKVISDLGLVYVEEGAQDIITYDEVNAAQ